jgi:serine protease Do
MKRNAVAWAALVLSVAAIISSRSFTKAVPAAQEIPEEGQRTAKALSDAFGAVAEFVKPSVVQINVEKKSALRSFGRGRTPSPEGVDPKDFEDFLKRMLPPGFKFEKEQFAAEGTGSGFVYDDKGHILTNNHVVNGADKIKVTFSDGVEMAATVVGTHPETDVAVIKVDATHYHPIPHGRSEKLKVGEWVLAFGSPFGLDQTVTAGIVSATERNDVQINQFESFIQTDAAINPGNSGGPLVDLNGRVVGINSAIATASRSNSGVGFAIPIDMAVRLADKLIKTGKVNPARVGVAIEPVTPALARKLGMDPKTKGLLVDKVYPGTPAEKAGLKDGDVITSFDHHPVNNRKDLQYLVATSDIGKTYPLQYVRDGKAHEANVAPAAAEKVDEAAVPKTRRAPSSSAPKAEVDDFGLAVQPMSPDFAKKYQYDEGAEGLVVTDVKEDSPAAQAGVEPGDRITKIIKDHKPQSIQSAKDFDDYVKHSDEITIFVEDVNKKLPGEFKILARPKK